MRRQVAGQQSRQNGMESIDGIEALDQARMSACANLKERTMTL
jgi:hypothetical protein